MSEAANDVVQIEQDGKVRIIRLNRPDKMNAISLELAWGVINAVREAQADDGIDHSGINGVAVGAGFALGMVGETVPDDQFDARFREYCQQLTNLSPITARSSKRVVRNAMRHLDLEGHLRYEVQNIRRAFGSRDGQEARHAFLEKRPPVFEGR
ncbi:MAG: enoyl-CoA hydratase/carnithine racemase [Candidatus Poriferisodalaceae bacterium]|jgi:enoyl-CoA hydratase/carnithine racemase